MLRAHAKLLFPILLVVACSEDKGPGPTDTPAILPPEATLSVAEGTQTRVVGTGEQLEFRVQVSLPGGGAVQGPVLFVAPDRVGSPGGAFTSGQVTENAYALVDVSASGEAVVAFTTNTTPGLYFVEAKIPANENVVRFSITQVPGRQLPSYTSAEADAVLVNEQLVDASSEVYGPFLIDRGDAIRPSVRQGEDAAAGLQANGPMWAYWIDDAPDQKFEHPTRLIGIVADGASAGTATVALGMSWAEVDLDVASDNHILLPPSSINEAILWPGEVSEARRALRAAQQLTTPFPAGTCGIAVHGPPERFLAADAIRMEAFMRDRLKLTRVYSKKRGGVSGALPPEFGQSDPVTWQELSTMFRSARADGCSGLLIYISAHGYDTAPGTRGIELAAGTSPTQRLGKHGVTWDQLASELENTFGRIDFIVDACYSENGATMLQGRSYQGKFLASADELLTSGAAQYGSLFLNPRSYYSAAALECWSDLVDEGVADALPEVHDCAKREGGEKVMEAEPEIDDLISAFLDFDAVDVTIPRSARVYFQGMPAHPSMSADRQARLAEIEFTTPGIVEMIAPPRFAARGLGGEFDFRPLANGSTDYEVVTRVNKRAYKGGATITVGGFELTKLEPNFGQVGDSVRIEGFEFANDPATIDVYFNDPMGGTVLTASISEVERNASNEITSLLTHVPVGADAAEDWEVYVEQGPPGARATSNRLAFRVPPLTGRIMVWHQGGITHMAPDGSDVVHPLVDPSLNFTDPALSPDYQKIAYASYLNNGIEVITSTGAPFATLLSPPNYAQLILPSWSADASKLVYIDPDLGGDVWTANADGTGAVRITPTIMDVRGWSLLPTFSPDGTKIAFIAYYSPDLDPHVYVIGSNGMNMVDVSTGVFGRNLSTRYDELAPIWSRDSQTVFFLGDLRLQAVQADGTNLRTISPSGQSIIPDRGTVKVSPDGQRIAYRAETSPDSIWVMDIDGQNPREVITHASSYENEPCIAWSPDSRAIVYGLNADGGQGEIRVVNVDTSTERVVHYLTVDNWAECVYWAP